MEIAVPVGGRVNVRRQDGDPAARSESDFFYKLRNQLLEEGDDVIKKEMAKDGHMVSDGIYYVRSRNTRRPGAFAIWDDQYAIRDTRKAYNRGEDLSLAYVDIGPEGELREPDVPRVRGKRVPAKYWRGER